MNESAPANPPEAFAGAVLAGGRSLRMGRDKALLVVSGERLVDRQLRVLAEAGARTRCIVVRDGPGPSELPRDVVVLRDDPGCEGPLAAVTAALAAGSERLTWILAVDMPLLEAADIRGMHLLASAECGVAPIVGGRFEPLAAVYPSRALAAARRRIAAGRSDVQGLVREGVEEGWMRAWNVPQTLAGRFLNWNSPGDLAAPPLP